MVSEQRKATRKARQKQTAEVFTPPKLVNDMLDKLPKKVWLPGKTFCDPACGDGAFLIWVLLRKIQKGHNALEALQTIYGVDIMKDNIAETRVRLLKIVSFFEKITADHARVVCTNIVCADSLQYDFEFDKEPTKATVDGFLRYIFQHNIFDKVEVPEISPKQKQKRIGGTSICVVNAN